MSFIILKQAYSSLTSCHYLNLKKDFMGEQWFAALP